MTHPATVVFNKREQTTKKKTKVKKHD